VVDGLVCPAIRCAISIVPPEFMYSVTPVARKLWQQTHFRIPLAFARFATSFNTLRRSRRLSSIVSRFLPKEGKSGALGFEARYERSSQRSIASSRIWIAHTRSQELKEGRKMVYFYNLRTPSLYHWFYTGDGRKCYRLTISDLYSRYIICCDDLASMAPPGVWKSFERNI
jgi:hypothetical protein